MRGGLAIEDFQTNRRCEARTPLSRRIDIMACEGHAAWGFVEAELTDCSAHGLSLLLSYPLPAGAQFLVKLRAGGKIQLLVYTVQNSQPAWRGRHRIGARLHGLAAGDACNDPEQIMAALLHEARSRA